jgi:copper transport protein
VTALAVVNRPAELVTTTYGRLLVAKLLVVVAVLVVALVARLRALKPFVPDLLRRLTRIEGAALLVVVAISAVLANAAPPQPRTTDLEELLGPAPLTGPVLRLADLAGQLALFLAAAEDQLQLQVVELTGETAQGAVLEITGTRPDGLGFDLYPRSCGPGCFSMDLDWQEGVTGLGVDVSHEKQVALRARAISTNPIWARDQEGV